MIRSFTVTKITGFISLFFILIQILSGLFGEDLLGDFGFTIHKYNWIVMALFITIHVFSTYWLKIKKLFKQKQAK